MKLLGLSLMFLSCTLIGFEVARRLKVRVDTLIQIRFVLEEICGNALYGQELLPTILRNLAEKEGMIHIWLTDLIANIEQDCFENAWRKSLKTLVNGYVHLEDIEMLESFGEQIVNRDKERLKSVIEEYEKFLDWRIDACRKECEVKAQMYRKLGVLMGFFITIIMV